MLTTIILDYDGIIRHLDREIADLTCQTKGFSFEELMSKVWSNDISSDLIRGKVTRQKWWDTVQSLNNDLEHVPQSFIWEEVFAIARIDTRVLEYVDELTEAYITVILSNADELSKRKIKEEVGTTKFDFIFTSSDFGSKKPEKEIFLQVLETLQVNPTECVFFDDRQANVEGARKVGIPAFLYDGLDGMKAIIMMLNSDAE
ncbi:MAG: HAD-IA family hydrolase [Candidatus Kariarchaeaceae archaeon]|jgi:putative hydrolase of the HAD superfamily